MSAGSSIGASEPSYDGTNLMLAGCVNPPMQVIGACGLSCSGCKAYMATQANDLEKLAELAKAWGKPESPFTVEEMRCNGCMSDVTFKGCASCGIRNSALEHDVKNCGECSDFACEKLTSQWTSFGVKPEDMKRNLGKN